MDGLRPFGLQPPLQAGLGGRKGAQAALVGLRKRLHVAHHQGDDAGLAVLAGAHVTHGKFELGNRFHRIHGLNQLAQRQQHGTHAGRKHGADLHVGHIAALALVESDQHCPLFSHKAHRQARAVAVAPSRALDGPNHVVRLELADVPEVVFQHALFDCHLGPYVQMLHLAAAAGAFMQAEVRAGRLHPLGGFGVDLGERAFLETGFAAVHLCTYHLKGQSAFNEYHLAIGAVGHALGFEIEGFHSQPAFWQRLGGNHVVDVYVCHP